VQVPGRHETVPSIVPFPCKHAHLLPDNAAIEEKSREGGDRQSRVLHQRDDIYSESIDGLPISPLHLFRRQKGETALKYQSFTLLAENLFQLEVGLGVDSRPGSPPFLGEAPRVEITWFRRCSQRSKTTVIIKEVQAKTILSASKVYDYVINPFVGCQHACSYCYARFMKRFTGHEEPWGEFVDVKVNAPDLLPGEIARKKPGRIWISGVCDPYQPLETRYELTRRCLGVLAHSNWPVVVQTRSPLVLRDLDILRQGKDFEVGLSITTADDDVRELFEPKAPKIRDRVRTLDELHKAGIRTYAMIAPMLPESEGLPEMLSGKVDYLLIDRMNYTYGNWVYRKHGLDDKMTDDFFYRTGQGLASSCRRLGIDCHVIF
jgi:DNA repair photolyase